MHLYKALPMVNHLHPLTSYCPFSFAEDGSSRRWCEKLWGLQSEMERWICSPTVHHRYVTIFFRLLCFTSRVSLDGRIFKGILEDSDTKIFFSCNSCLEHTNEAIIFWWIGFICPKFKSKYCTVFPLLQYKYTRGVSKKINLKANKYELKHPCFYFLKFSAFYLPLFWLSIEKTNILSYGFIIICLLAYLV